MPLIAPSAFGTQPFGTSLFGVGYRDITLTVGTPRWRTLSAHLEGRVEISRIERRFQTIPVSAADEDGNAVTLTAVDVAALPPRTRPDVDTVWQAATYADGEATVLLAGPDADPDGALAVPAAGADLWLRVTDTPEVLTAKAGRIYVL